MKADAKSNLLSLNTSKQHFRFLLLSLFVFFYFCMFYFLYLKSVFIMNYFHDANFLVNFENLFIIQVEQLCKFVRVHMCTNRTIRNFLLSIRRIDFKIV